ncbi:zinc-binding dehydrogenase, partial [Mycobacterium sp.]|uniref:zinc-binding dehydrogenase n=1 Tax=Mycobacterium sp. TaxID=1785 RepID=UPI003F99B90C
LLARLRQRECELCETGTTVAVHQVAGIRELGKPKTGQPAWAAGVGAALWTAEVEVGSTVAVFGCGGVGQAAIQGAHLASAARIIAIDPVPLKRGAALRLGATEAIDPLCADAVEQVRELTGGRGAEYTFDVAGRVDTMRPAFEAACLGGTVTFVGGPQSGLELALPANLMRSQGKRILGSHYGSAQIHRDMPRLVKLAEVGRLDIADMVSRRLPSATSTQPWRDRVGRRHPLRARPVRPERPDSTHHTAFRKGQELKLGGNRRSRSRR